jgi:2'-hydroxyisoflavone reductase
MAMKVLLLGGTRFLGRHLVTALQAAGHAVTLFNRGRTAPGLYAGSSAGWSSPIEQLRGTRDGDLAALAGRRWDAVIDTCGYVPRVVRQSAEALRGAVGCYLFVSSISVYADDAAAGQDENAPVAALSNPASEDIGRDYGALKAACEQVVSQVFGSRALHVRPGLIVGPWDPTGRFTYWVDRLARGGEVLAPAPAEAPVQLIHAADLAAFIVRLLEDEASGVFNATGPQPAATFAQMLDACRTTRAAQITWVAPEFLLAQQVEPWSNLPLWLPADSVGTLQVDISRARAAGLQQRSLAETAAATLAWRMSAEGAAFALDANWTSVGLTAEREAELLAAWRQQP